MDGIFIWKVTYMSDLKSHTKTLRFFWQHATDYPFLLWGMVLSYPVALLFRRFLPALVVAGILQRLSAHQFTHGDIWGSFGSQILLAVGYSALGGIAIQRFTSYCNWKLEGYVMRDINQQVFDHLMRLSASFHANRFGGSLVSQTSKLANAYVRIADTSMYQVSSLFWTLIFTNFILWSRATVFVVLLDIFCLIFILCSVIVTKRVRYANSKEAEASNRQTGQLADSLTNVMAVKSFAAGQSEGHRFGEVSEKARQAHLQLMRSSIQAQTVFTSLNSVILGIAVVALVASIVIYDTPIAVVFLIFTYVQEIRSYLWEFGDNALRNYNRALGDSQEMMSILELEPSVQDPAQPERSRISAGAITFRHMSFTHPEAQSDDTLFEDLNLAIKPGEKIGLVGHSGSGKTTLTKLLLRFDDIDGGQILIDDQDITHISQDDLRRHIAYVPQEPLLFHRSIRENIAYSQPDASEADILQATRQAHAADFIEHLPQGFETLVGERGVKLSGGQRQRVAIARALLKDAPILVLDEATSALDSESEKLIQDALWKLMARRTAIVIAHRLSTIQKMDRILVLEDGAIVEEGTHKQLLRAKGTYAKLWAHQSGGFLEE